MTIHLTKKKTRKGYYFLGKTRSTDILEIVVDAHLMVFLENNVI